MKGTWMKLRTLAPAAGDGVYFGVTDFGNIPCAVYPDRVMKKGSTVIWIPEKKAHVGIASYVDAQRNGDEAALAKLESLGVPRGVNFGYGPKDDLTCTYAAAKKPRAKKADSVKVMRADFAGLFEDGGRFRPGEPVKILFRKKFVEDVAGVKKFRNVYVRPTPEELEAAGV